MNIRESGWRWLPVSVLLLVLDQLSKLWVVRNVAFGESPRKVLPVMDFVLHYNRGVSWSWFASASGWQRWLFSALALAVSAVILVWLRRLDGRGKWRLALALALILAGAVGNLIDRVWMGQVVDFIFVHWNSVSFPAFFNVADVAITVGAGLLLIDSLGDR
jgi:signal peptidase II